MNSTEAEPESKSVPLDAFTSSGKPLQTKTVEPAEADLGARVKAEMKAVIERSQQV